MDDTQSIAETNVNEINIEDFATLRNKNYNSKPISRPPPVQPPPPIPKIQQIDEEIIDTPEGQKANISFDFRDPFPVRDHLQNSKEDMSNEIQEAQESRGDKKIPNTSTRERMSPAVQRKATFENREEADIHFENNESPSFQRSESNRISRPDIMVRSAKEEAMESEAKINMIMNMKLWGVEHPFTIDSPFEALSQHYKFEEQVHNRRQQLMFCRELVGAGAGVLAFGFNIADRKLLHTGVSATEWQDDFTKTLHATQVLDNDLQSLSQTCEQYLPGSAGAMFRIAFHMGNSLHQYVRATMEENNRTLKMLEKQNEASFRKSEEKMEAKMDDMLKNYMNKMAGAKENHSKESTRTPLNKDPNPFSTFANAQEANERLDEEFEDSSSSSSVTDSATSSA